MPRDKRLWMTFPIDMHRHPKITRLPMSARWAFFEMNGEARMEDNDGIFPAADAEHLWGKKVLDQLVSSHPSRPLVIRDGDVYRIRDYAEHQETRADREARQRRNQENGKLGGRPRKNRVGSGSVTSGNRVATESQPTTNPAATEPKPESESESESELETDSSNTGSVSPVSDRANDLGLTDRGIASIRNAVNLHCDIDATEAEAVELAAHITSKAKTAPTHPGAYVRNAIETGPSEIDAWFRAARATRKRGTA